MIVLCVALWVHDIIIVPGIMKLATSSDERARSCVSGREDVQAFQIEKHIPPI